MNTQIINSLTVLKDEGVLLYPTDTIWGLGCDATSDAALERVYKIKQRDTDKSMIVLVSDWEMLKQYVQQVPKNFLEIMQKFSKPTTAIYNKPKNLSQKLIAKDNTIAIRVVQHPFCKNLIQQFGKPITSTSANISGETSPKKYEDISETIKNKVDYIVDWDKDLVCEKSSAIVKIKNDKVLFIRK